MPSLEDEVIILAWIDAYSFLFFLSIFMLILGHVYIFPGGTHRLSENILSPAAKYDGDKVPNRGFESNSVRQSIQGSELRAYSTTDAVS